VAISTEFLEHQIFRASKGDLRRV